MKTNIKNIIITVLIVFFLLTIMIGTVQANTDNHEYTQTYIEIIEQPWKKEKISWEPITINTSILELNIYKTDLRRRYKYAK